MGQPEANRDLVGKIKQRVSQQQVKQALRIFYSLFLICMLIMTGLLLALEFDYLMIALMLGLLCSQIAMATEKWLYEGDQFSWSEFVGR
jgi:1,4-dihydroxy-2-naphthoate octaprenyltransferase